MGQHLKIAEFFSVSSLDVLKNLKRKLLLCRKLDPEVKFTQDEQLEYGNPKYSFLLGSHLILLVAYACCCIVMKNIGHSVMQVFIPSWNIERTKVVKTVYQEKVRFELTCVETGVRGGSG